MSCTPSRHTQITRKRSPAALIITIIVQEMNQTTWCPSCFFMNWLMLKHWSIGSKETAWNWKRGQNTLSWASRQTTRLYYKNMSNITIYGLWLCSRIFSILCPRERRFSRGTSEIISEIQIITQTIMVRIMARITMALTTMALSTMEHITRLFEIADNTMLIIALHQLTWSTTKTETSQDLGIAPGGPFTIQLSSKSTTGHISDMSQTITRLDTSETRVWSWRMLLLITWLVMITI